MSEGDVRALYERVLDGWNRHSAEDFAAPFADDGEIVGWDGSENHGREAIAAELGRIFADHETGAYVGKVRSFRMLAPGVGLLRAVAGVVPAGATDIDPKLNSVQALVAVESDGEWRVALYHNTPAQLHGQSAAADALTEELRAELRSSRA